jgi:hypothetical protein
MRHGLIETRMPPLPGYRIMRACFENGSGWNRRPACVVRRPAGRNGGESSSPLGAAFSTLFPAVSVGGSPTGAGESPALPIFKIRSKPHWPLIMNCQEVRQRLPEFIEGNLPEAVRGPIDAHLRQCPGCQEEMVALKSVWTKLRFYPELQPSPALRNRFHASLEAYRLGMTQSRSIGRWSSNVRQWLTAWFGQRPIPQFAAAMSLFIAGLLMGLWLSFLRSPGSDTAALRAEVAGLRHEMGLALMRQSSASERLTTVNEIARTDRPDDMVLATLLRVLNADPEVNVRLAAIEALKGFADHRDVRQGLVQSLIGQDSPLVQIELINLLVDLREHRSCAVLEALARDTRIDASVRERAAWGLQHLT